MKTIIVSFLFFLSGSLWAGDAFFPSDSIGRERIKEDTLVITVKRDNFSITVYPNPFRNASTISYNLDVPDTATLKIYDVEGREVKTIFKSAALEKGEHVVEFTRESLPSGFYLVQFMSRKGRFAKQVILVE